jgi:hypothetical protein
MVTTSHIDEATMVVCFLQGLNDGPIKKHLFREYPDTLEKAISRALEEDFSAREAARARSFMGTQSSKSNNRQKNYAPRAHSEHRVCLCMRPWPHRLQRKLDMLGVVSFLLLDGEYIQCKRRRSAFIRALRITQV